MIKLLTLLSVGFLFLLGPPGCNGTVKGPPTGTEGGQCFANGTCFEGLVCLESNLCAAASSDPCENIDCSSHGQCAVRQDEAFCNCDDGYHAVDLSCVQDQSSCDGVDCSGHGTCQLQAGIAVCNCDDGYHAVDLSCVENQASCDELTAGQNFDIEVFIDTSGRDLGAFDVYFDFAPTQMIVDLSQGENPGEDSGRGFHKGSDTSEYIMMSNSEDVANGHFRFAGIAAQNNANGNKEHLATIHAKCVEAFAIENAGFAFRINALSDELGLTFTPGSITWNILCRD